MTLNDYFTSFVRTATPVVVGALLASKAGPFIDPDAAAQAVTAGFAVVYYALIRGLEALAGPQWGWFLGVPKQPVYGVDTGDLAAVPADQRQDVDG